MKYDYVIIGAGLSACVSARLLADKGYKILIVERRNHLGGNLFDEKNEDGILVQKYGPHTFHTNNDKVIDFVTRYADFEEYHLKCEVNIDGVITPSPFNFKTIDQFYDVDKAKMLKEKLNATYPLGKATVLELLDSKDKDIKEYADFLFEKDYSLYTSKQWGISPSEVDPSVLRRVPVEFSYKDWYFYDKFEGIPKGGFMQFINNMLNSANIETKTGINGLEHISFKDNKVLYDNDEVNVIFTGETDELFNYKFGKLPYRSLRFEYEKHNKKDYQTSAIVAYPSHDYGYTRITEYTKLPYQKFYKTLIVKEYPLSYDSYSNNEPYYPILTKDSQEMFKCYMDEASKYSNLILLGRLAQFKYYNMDQCILNAINMIDSIQPKSSIYVVTHKKIELFGSSEYQIVQSGAAINQKLGYLRDDTGDNISMKNLMYNEYDVIYWVYKNRHNKNVAFCHYRRFFKGNLKTSIGNVLSCEEMDSCLKEYDIIVAKKKRLFRSVSSHYIYARRTMVNIHKNDLLQLGLSIKALKPDYYESYNRILKSHSCHYYNMFAMSQKTFNDYCDFVFLILFDFEKRIEKRTRVCGAMGEILLNIFIDYNKLKICEKKIINVEKNSLLSKIKRHFS